MSSTTYTVSMSPHERSNTAVRRSMTDVLIALLPAAAAGIYYFKTHALLIMLVSILSCVAVEALWQRLTGDKVRIGDLSAVVTGLLLALNLPSTVPLWIPLIGGIFAIVIVKQFFGGIGQNFMNPALAARAFLLASWAVPMTRLAVDATASASTGQLPSLWELLKGPMGGYIGEVSVFALLIGGLYLLIRRVITPRVPLAYLSTVFVLTWVLGGQGLFQGDPVRDILSGAIMLGALFMATDPSTSPTTGKGQYIMGAGCGMLTVIFKVYGHNAEGFMYAILIMNLFVPFIEKFTTPRQAVEVK